MHVAVIVFEFLVCVSCFFFFCYSPPLLVSSLPVFVVLPTSFDCLFLSFGNFAFLDLEFLGSFLFLTLACFTSL